MKHMLMLASVASMIDQFNMPNINLLQEMGYVVDVACNFEKGNTCSVERIEELKKLLKQKGVNFFQVDFSRDVNQIHTNIKAYKQVITLIKEKNYKFIHCHSPIGGIIGRLAARNNNTKVIYTAHGFHFYKNGPIKSWLLYYPIEKIFSRYTDALITINNEDYNRAKSYMHAKKTYKIPGVGVNVDYFSNYKINRDDKREQLGMKNDSIVLLSVGELNENKNHEIIIRALARIKNSNIHYFIAGKGDHKEYLINLSNDLGVINNVHLLGFRNDLDEIYNAVDIFCFPSLREGLGLSALEAMASGIPLITSNVHGINDYSKNGVTGYACNPNDLDAFVTALEKLYNNKELREKMGHHNIEESKKFAVNIVNKMMNIIYTEVSG